jgi:hypothetical protein
MLQPPDTCSCSRFFARRTCNECELSMAAFGAFTRVFKSDVRTMMKRHIYATVRRHMKTTSHREEILQNIHHLCHATIGQCDLRAPDKKEANCDETPMTTAACPHSPPPNDMAYDTLSPGSGEEQQLAKQNKFTPRALESNARRWRHCH